MASWPRLGSCLSVGKIFNRLWMFEKVTVICRLTDGRIRLEETASSANRHPLWKPPLS